MDDTERRAFLSSRPAFCHADAQSIERLARGLSRRELVAGETLFEEGDPGAFVFLVESGELQAWKRSDQGRPVALRVLGPGEVGGLTSTALERERSASVRAIGSVVVHLIDAACFREVLADRADLGRSLLAHLSEKVRRKTAQLATLMARSEEDPRPSVVVFDAKAYDRRHLQAAANDLCLRFVEARLGVDTAALATGHRAVCAFVNDDLSAPVLERLAAGGVELIALRCAGFNNVDLAAAQRLGISVTRVPAYSPHAVAEHAMALILSLNRKVHRAYQRVREGNFAIAGLEGFDLHGKTAGIVGVGKIGSCLAAILRGFGMTVLGHDAAPDPALARSLGLQLVSLDALLERADIVSLHAPLTPSTRHMIDAAALARAKRGVMLINTSRGALVDTSALIEGLKTGQVGAAGLDVYEEESEYFFEDRSDRVITDDVLARLLTFPNVLVTSHQAFLTTDALDNIAATTVSSLRQFFAGRRGAELDYAVSCVLRESPAPR